MGGFFARSEGFDIAHKLPALRLRQLRPNRHAAADNSIGEDPEQRASRSLLHFAHPQARPFMSAFAHFAVTLGAVLVEELAARHDGFGITLQWITTALSFRRSFRQFGINILLLWRVSIFLSFLRAC